MNIEKHIFGQTGRIVTSVGFGGAPIGYLKTDRDQINTILNYLLDQGVNLIDTAAVYPGSEEAIGATIGHRRQEYLLVSKCGWKVPDIEAQPWSPAMITQAVDRSLRLLKTEVIDVMLLHSCDLPTLQRGDALAALVEARQAGKIRWAGYSGDNEAAACAAGLKDIAVIQTSISIADQANIDHVLPIARENNVAVMAKRPLANAAWKKPLDQRGIYNTYSREYHERLRKMNISPVELGILGPAETAWPELALRFTLSQHGVHCAIIGTTNPEHARTNLQAAEKGPLPPAAVEKLRATFNSAKGTQDWPGLQ